MSEQGTPPNTDSLSYLQGRFRAFRDARDWQQFHTPKSTAANVVIEAAELLDCYRWTEAPANRQAAVDEAADVLHALFAYCDAERIDLAAAFLEKLAKTAAKYPVEKSKGNNAKYTTLQ